MTRKLLAAIQLIFVGFVVGFGTYHLYRGNFELAFASLPFLFTYYIFVTARAKRRRYEEEEDDEKEK